MARIGGRIVGTVQIDPTQIDAEHRSLRVGIERAALAAYTIFDPGAFLESPTKA